MPGSVFRARCFKSHLPFNLHIFRPCPPPPVSPPFLSVLYSLPAWLRTVSVKSPQTGQKGCREVCCPLFPNKGTNRHTDGPRGIARLSRSLSDLPDSIAAKGQKCTAVFTEIGTRRPSFDKTPCPYFCHCRLCCCWHSTQTSVCNAIPACFLLIIAGLLSQVFVFLLVLFGLFLTQKAYKH